MENGQSAEKNYAYLLGLYFGDGHIEKRSDNNYIFRLQSIDEDFVQYTASLLSEIAGKYVKVHSAKRKTTANRQVYECSLGNIYFKKLYEDTYGGKAIPQYVFDWSREEQMEFIKGILDSDGYISMRSNGHNTKFECGYRITYSWIIDVKRIFNILGIETKKLIEIPQKHPKKDIFSFHINLKSLAQTEFNFNIKRKQNKLNAYREKHWRSFSQRLYARPA